MFDFRNIVSETKAKCTEDDTSTDGVTCTCPKSEATSGKRSVRERPQNLDLGSNTEHSSSSALKGYDWQLNRRYISAGSKSIEGDGRALVITDDFSRCDLRPTLAKQTRQHEPRGFSTSRRSIFAGHDDLEGPDCLKRTYTSLNGERRELTPFEKDNLLFIQELKEKQKQALRDFEKQVKDLPNLRFLRHSLSNPGCEADFGRCYSDENTPRSGSPFPRRREFPPTAFSPSKTARSQALRSLSLDEEIDDDLEEGDLEEGIGWRKNSSDLLGLSGTRGGERKPRSCQTSQLSPADTWWNNLGSSPLNSPSFSRKTVPSLIYTRSSAPSTPVRTPLKDTSLSFEPGIAKQKFSVRSYSSPASTVDRRTFKPFDLSLSFVNFHNLPKCRPELEDVGGNFSSILSTSPEDNTSVQRTMLPTTQEAIHEDLSDEDISRKKPPTEPKSPQTPGLPQPKSTNAITTTTTNSNPTALPKTTTVTSPKTPPSSTPSDIAPSATGESSENGETEPGAPKPSPAETKKPIPMAFTIELDSAASDSSTSGNSTKKLDITASISQWAPKHRRNLSLTKVEEHKKVEERQGSEKPPLGRPRSGTVGAGTPLGSKRVGAGYHSEGYFSSDQDDEAPKRTDLKSPRSPRTPETSHPPPVLVRSNSQDSSKGNSIRKHGNKPQGRSCCKERERKPSVSELTGKSYKSDKKMGSDSKKQTKNSPTEEIDPSKDDKDDVSEAGTYTIDKDSPSPEEDQARNDINGVFGVPTESEAELTSTTATAVPASTTDNFQEDESSWMSASEIPPSISRNSPNWIQQWAAHVAEQTKPQLESVPSLPKSSVTSPRGHKLLMASHENDFRPRRKLPTPPSHMNAPSSGLSPRADPASFANHKQFWRDQTLNSDLTSDTEAYLRDTENLVSSLQARVDKTKEENSAFRNASFESHESGGDSDFDTSFSYPFNDDDRMVPSLKSKLKLTGLLPTSKNMPNPSSGMISPRRPEGGVVKDPKLKKSRGEVAARDPSYDMFAQKKEDRGLHSDSSSEASEPYKDLPRTNDKNLPLKYNRAFSLRRARLGCEDPVSTQSMDKKKISRPSSAGAAVSTRKAPLGSTKSYQSVDSPSVSSPRCCGFGSPRGIASPSQSVGSKGTPHSPSQSVGSKGTPHSPSQSVGSKGTPHSDNFDRTDGGRFSLRLARTGSSSISTVKSPSKNSLKKDQSSSKKNATRSNSTLSSKEVDFQNWKRRKNYDPMKAAAEGKKKQVEKLKNVQPPPLSAENQSPSPPGSLLRSASFHGTEGVLSNLRWTRKACNNHPQYTSEDDGPYSLEEEMGPHPSPHHGSPLHRSPTSPHQLCQSPARQLPPPRGRRPSLGHSDEGDPQYQSSLRKISLDESGSEGKRSPLNGGTRGAGNLVSGAGRPKTKMEALDNLVISTIHSLSVKVRSTSESLLQKLKSHFDEEGDRAALLEEVLSHLSESDQSLASGQTRSTSRELAGILRNLKKIEHALEVIDRVIIIGEEEYRDDDIDYVPTEWVEDCDY